MTSETQIDARGHRCPVPTLKLRKALAEAAAGTRVCLLADDPMARIDVPHFAAQNGYVVESLEETAGGLRFIVLKPAA